MATYSSILASEIPWTEEPGGLQSMGSKKSDMTENARLSLNTYIHIFSYSYSHAVCLNHCDIHLKLT